MIQTTECLTDNHLTDRFQAAFDQGIGFSGIRQARKFAGQELGFQALAGTPQAKRLEEAIEVALVKSARRIVCLSRNLPPNIIFDRLVDLYHRQPRLGSRSSTSALRQQYSTPIPIAYLVAVLAQVNDSTTVFEPTAGNGALLITSNPLAVYANEIDLARARNLRQQGYVRVSEIDATSSCVLPHELCDRLLLNPPFGSFQRLDGMVPGNETWLIFNQGCKSALSTDQIDRAIAWQTLGGMKPDGRAVLLLGGERTGQSDHKRSNAYNSLHNRKFFKVLYENYRVECHFTIDGNLYQKQGAGFPVDVVVIDGRGKTDKPLPAVKLPHVYLNFAELKELLPPESATVKPPLEMWYSGVSSQRELEILLAAGVKRILLDPFQFRKLKNDLSLVLPEDVELMLDSGAYAAFKSRRPLLAVSEFLDVAHESFVDRNGTLRNFNRVVAPDVIQNPELTLTRWNEVKKLVLPWIPIWQWGGDRAVLEQMLCESPVVGIGGLVPLMRAQDSMMLEQLQRLCNEFPRRFHLFGLCWMEALDQLKFQVASADTSAWLSHRSGKVICVNADGRLKRFNARRFNFSGSSRDWCIQSARNLHAFLNRQVEVDELTIDRLMVLDFERAKNLLSSEVFC